MTDTSLTKRAESPPGLASVLQRNIRRMRVRKRQDEANAALSQRLADRMTAFSGSMTFAALHAALYGAWIAINLGWIRGVPRFDPTFVILAMEASVEAIFLSTFVLISQNRMMAAAARQAELDLQINLLAEHELTRLAVIVEAIAKKLDVESGVEPELAEITRDVAPEAVLDEIAAYDKMPK